MEENETKKTDTEHRIYYKKVERTLNFYMIVAVLGFFIINSKNNIYTSLIGITILYILKKVANYYRTEAESSRRANLYDNSFDSKFCVKNHNEYYDNNHMELGFEKLLANVHQSSFFTKNILEKMLFKRIILFSILLLIIIYMSTEGLKNYKISIDIFNIFLSGYFLDGIFEMFQLKYKCSNIFNRSNEYWNDKESLDSNIAISKKINIIIDYETALSSSSFILTEAIYIKYKLELDKEWLDIQKRYDI